MKSNGGAMLAGAAASAPIQTVHVGPGRRHDRDRAHRRRVRRAECAHARHGRDERRRRHPRRRQAAPHDRVRDRMGRAGRGAADRHQVDRRRRRLDRLGRRRRLPARRPEERGRAARPGLLRPRRRRRRPSPTRTSSSAGSIPTTSSQGGCGSTSTRRAVRSRSWAGGSAWARSSSPPRSSRSRTRTWRARSRWSRSSAATTPVGSRCSRSAAPGPLHAAAVARLLDIPRVIVPRLPGRLLRARAAARRHPGRQGVDAGVPLERRRRRVGQPAVGDDRRARGRRAAPGGLRRRARAAALDQHALPRPELRARGRDRGRRARRRCARALRSGASTRCTPPATGTRSTTR